MKKLILSLIIFMLGWAVALPSSANAKTSPASGSNLDITGKWKDKSKKNSVLIKKNGSKYQVKFTFRDMGSFGGDGKLVKGKIRFTGTDSNLRVIEGVIFLNSKKDKIKVKYTNADWLTGTGEHIKTGRIDKYLRT